MKLRVQTLLMALVFAAENLAAIKKAITDEFQFPLDEADVKSLGRVYQSFHAGGFEIGFRMSRRDGSTGSFAGPPPGGFRGGGGFGPFPSLKDLLTQTDLNGKQGNFLASVDDYEFVRGLQRISVFVKDFDVGRHTSYDDLISTNYIAAEKPAER